MSTLQCKLCVISKDFIGITNFDAVTTLHHPQSIVILAVISVYSYVYETPSCIADGQCADQSPDRGRPRPRLHWPPTPTPPPTRHSVVESLFPIRPSQPATKLSAARIGTDRWLRARVYCIQPRQTQARARARWLWLSRCSSGLHRPTTIER